MCRQGSTAGGCNFDLQQNQLGQTLWGLVRQSIAERRHCSAIEALAPLPGLSILPKDAS